jgi:hypothetical protein
MAFSNDDGTLPRGMVGFQANAAETSLTLFYTTSAGVVKSSVLPLT